MDIAVFKNELSMEHMEKKELSECLSTILGCIVIAMSSCANKQSQETSIIPDREVDTFSLVLEDELQFNYNNDEPSQFGVEYFDHGLPIGQPSLTIDEETLFVVDEYHNNVKKIELPSKKIISSERLSQESSFLHDIIVFDDLLYVSGEMDTIFVLDKALKLVKKIPVRKGRISFTRTYGRDSLVVYCHDAAEYITLSGDTVVNAKSVSHEQRGNEIYFKNKMVKSLTDSLYETNIGIISTTEDLYFDDIDFDSLKLAAIKQDSANLRVLIFGYRRR